MNTISNLNRAPGNTPLTPDELAQLIPSLGTKEELNQFERLNILSAREWAMGTRVMKREDPLSEPYLRELHKKMFDATWKWAGKYRTTEKINLGVPVHEIRERIPALLADTLYWIANKTFDLDEIAVRFHHGLVSIHPFPNGNGRHARLVADVIVVKNGREPFTWGPEELDDEPDRDEYIRLLKLADANHDDMSGLVNFARS